MPSLLIATSNPGKAAEFDDLFRPLGWTTLSLRDLPPVPEPEETGLTFLENAQLKAAAYARAHRLPTLADDSGLEVDALDGAPGVHSAYWAHHHGAPYDPDRPTRDHANRQLLLKQLEAVPDDRRTARFVCVLAVADANGNQLLHTRGTVEGLLLRSPRGQGGFGYDPLFLIPPLSKTTAELTPAEKHTISHRGQATRHLLPLLTQLPPSPTSPH